MQPAALKRRPRVLAGRFLAARLPARTRARRWLRLILKDHKSVGRSRGRAMASIIAIIPARMGSSRFPGKPLAPLLGRPMIEHVVRRAMMCYLRDAVYVAPCDWEIRDVVVGCGASVIMAWVAQERARDRVAGAAETLEADIVVMIQGDEPMITPGMIASAVAPLIRDPSVECVNLTRR